MLRRGGQARGRGPPPSPPKQPEAPITTETQTTAQHRPANARCIRQVSVLQRRRSTERELRCGDASMSEPPPSTSAPDRHDLLAVRTIDSRIGALASALELPSAAMIRRDRGDSEGMMGLRAAEEQLAVRAGVGARPPRRVSISGPPSRTSSPLLPKMSSAPWPPLRVSSRGRPLMWSLPGPPKTRSSPKPVLINPRLRARVNSLSGARLRGPRRGSGSGRPFR